MFVVPDRKCRLNRVVTVNSAQWVKVEMKVIEEDKGLQQLVVCLDDPFMV